MIRMGLLQAQVSLCESDDTVMADGQAGFSLAPPDTFLYCATPQGGLGLTFGFPTCGSRDIR